MPSTIATAAPIKRTQGRPRLSANGKAIVVGVSLTPEANAILRRLTDATGNRSAVVNGLLCGVDISEASKNSKHSSTSTPQKQ